MDAHQPQCDDGKSTAPRKVAKQPLCESKTGRGLHPSDKTAMEGPKMDEKQPDKERRCKDCHYYRPVESMRGDCRRYGPRAVGNDAMATPQWPRVGESDFCREFMAAEENVGVPTV